MDRRVATDKTIRPGRRPTLTRRQSSLSPRRLGAAVDVLAESGLFDSRDSRILLIGMVADALRTSLNLAEHPTARLHLVELVRGCDRIHRGLRALVQAVRAISERVAEDLDDALTWPAPVPQQFDPASCERIGRLLDAAEVPDPGRLALRSGAAVPALAEVSTASDAFLLVKDVTSGEYGLPPALVLAELVAARADRPDARIAIRSWCDEQARTLGIGEVVTEFRRSTAALLLPRKNDHLVLMVLVEPTSVVTEFQVSYWQQAYPGEWPPAREGDTRVTLDPATHQVDHEPLRSELERIILAAERKWSGHEGQVSLEIVVPRALLGLPVDRWSVTLDGWLEQMIGLKYRTTLRSYERMRHPELHRSLRARWKILETEPAEIGWHQPSVDSVHRRHAIEATLGELRTCMLLVLPQSPTRPTALGEDCLGWVLGAGLPGMVWARGESAPGETYDTVDWMLKGHSVALVPERAHALRHDAAVQQPEQPAPAIGQELAVLWDSPERFIELGAPLGLPAPGSPWALAGG